MPKGARTRSELCLRARYGSGDAYLGRRECMRKPSPSLKRRLDSVAGVAGDVASVRLRSCKGRSRQALKMLGRMRSNRSTEMFRRLRSLVFYTGLGDKEQALYWLEKAYEERDY